MIKPRDEGLIWLESFVPEWPEVAASIAELAAFYEAAPLQMPVVLDVAGEWVCGTFDWEAQRPEGTVVLH